MQLLKKGVLIYNKLEFIRTDYRIEFLTKKTVAEIINKFYETLKNKRFIVIYSHEYEFKKKIILSTLNKTMDILTNKLKLKNIHP